MKITKHGVHAGKGPETEEFECGKCGCRFTADSDEYYVDKDSHVSMPATLTYVFTASVIDTYVCSCPECQKIVVKTKERPVENQTSTLSGIDTDTKNNSTKSIPDPCKACPNHPSNGGSGNCNCILGSMGQVTC